MIHLKWKLPKCHPSQRPHNFLAFILVIITASSHALWAQENSEELGANVRWEAGFHVGNLLPHQINGMSEITGMGGVRGGYRLSEYSFFEAGFISGNGWSTEWKNLHATFRSDKTIEGIVASIMGGLDLIQYKGTNRPESLLVGGHIGGGLMAQVGGSTWFRSDMKFNIRPGTSLYIGFGLVFRL